MADEVYPVIALLDSGIQPAALPAAAVLDGINLSGAGAASDISDASSAHGSLMATSILREAPQVRFLVVNVLDSRGWLSEPARLDEAFEWQLLHERQSDPGEQHLSECIYQGGDVCSEVTERLRFAPRTPQRAGHGR